MDTEARGGDAVLGGHYLVAVSGSRNSEYLIRWTAANAKRMGVSWTALHVRGGSSEANPDALDRNLELARTLGAEVQSIADQDVAAAIVRYARIKKATALVIGKTGGEGPLIGKRGVMDAILRESGDLDLIVLHGKNPILSRHRVFKLSRLPAIFRGLPIALLVLSLITIFGFLSLPLLGYKSVSILYLLAIICLPFACGRAAVLAGAAFSALAWNFLFIPPRMTFSIGSLEDILMFAAFFAAALVGGFLTSRLKDQEAAVSRREARLAILYGFVRALARTRGLVELARLAADFGKEHLGASVAVYSINNDGQVDLRAPMDAAFSTSSAGEPFNVPVDKAAVQRCLDNGRMEEGVDGRFYIPLGEAGSSLAVLAVYSLSPRVWSGEDRELLSALAGNLALAMEREILAVENERNKMAGESERLTRVLLNHVSHELRTPLTTIKGSISGLLQDDSAEDPALRAQLLSETLVAADKLNSLVEDLLSMSRLETGSLKPRPETVDVAELLGVAQEGLAAELVGRGVVIDPACRDAELEVDPALMVHVFRNILRNFIVYAGQNAVLKIGVRYEADRVIIDFIDNGPGVGETELPVLFSAFYRGSNSVGTRGCGLGLAICRGVTEAHGGSIEAAAASAGGLRVSLNLARK